MGGFFLKNWKQEIFLFRFSDLKWLQFILFFSGYAICRYRKSSLQSGLVETFIRASVNSWLLTKSNPSLEVPKLSPGKFLRQILWYTTPIKAGSENKLYFLDGSAQISFKKLVKNWPENKEHKINGLKIVFSPVIIWRAYMYISNIWWQYVFRMR